MSKQQFIDGLRAALNGRVSSGLVTENVNYYEDYINTEIRKGRTEEEVMKSLGDPRLIARTIIEMYGKDSTARNTGYGQTGGQSSEYQDAGYQNAGYRRTDYGNSSYQGSSQNRGYAGGDFEGYGEKNRRRSIRIPGWLMVILMIIVAVLVISAVFSVLSFLAPLIVVMAAVLFLVKLFRDWLN